MKRIKILNRLVLIILILKALWLLGDYVILFMTDYGIQLKEYGKDLVFGHYNWYLRSLISIITIFGIFFIYMGLSRFLTEGFFNLYSIENFKRAAICFVLSGIMSLILEIFTFIKSEDFKIITYLNENLLLVFFGIGLLIITEITKDGRLLKTENDLTI